MRNRDSPVLTGRPSVACAVCGLLLRALFAVLRPGPALAGARLAVWAPSILGCRVGVGSSQSGHPVSWVVGSVWGSSNSGLLVSWVLRSAWWSSQSGHLVFWVVWSAWGSSQSGHLVSWVVQSAAAVAAVA